MNKHSKIRPIVGLTQKDITRFMANLSVNSNGCIDWIGSLNKQQGSGIFFFNGRPWVAHRIAYCLENGNPPRNLIIIQLCKNKICVNTDHLEAVSRAENIFRSESNFNHSRKLACPRGHSLSGKNLINTPKRVGRACKPCDNAGRMARDRGLVGEEKELFIVKQAALIVAGRGFRQVA